LTELVGYYQGNTDEISISLVLLMNAHEFAMEFAASQRKFGAETL
jgi:hypothetical protein